MRNSTPLVSFIVLGWNNRDLLEECFASINNQTYRSFSIIYVDNGSTDDSVEYVRADHPDITVIEVGKNEGFAIGNNIGIRHALMDASCAYVAFVNTDATLATDWLSTLVLFAEEHPGAASFQTPTYDYYDHSVLDSYGIVVDHQGRAMQLGYRSSGELPETKIVFGTNAAASLYSRAFLEAQPFANDYLDSDLWMYLEDVDLAARATIMGWSNWFVAKSAAYHMGSASSGKNPGFSVYHIYRNNFPMLFKNFPLLILVGMIPGLIVTDIKTIIELIRGRNKVALKALVRGRLDGLKLLPIMSRKRKTMRAVQQINTADLWNLMKR